MFFAPNQVRDPEFRLPDFYSAIVLRYLSSGYKFGPCRNSGKTGQIEANHQTPDRAFSPCARWLFRACDGAGVRDRFPVRTRSKPFVIAAAILAHYFWMPRISSFTRRQDRLRIIGVERFVLGSGHSTNLLRPSEFDESRIKSLLLKCCNPELGFDFFR
jgi:hypothetical protein